MKQVVFLFAVHNHQPLGNFSSVFDLAYEQAYWPFLKTVSHFPHFRFALHFSGFLWEYLEKYHPEALELIGRLQESGQIELLGGAFYEPVLAQIPEADRAAQLNLMEEFLLKHFNFRPKGLWLAERVWEPHLASFLSRAGYEFTLLDEEHFHYAGAKSIHGYYVTEDEGLAFKIFPIDKTLRYYIPFRTLPELENYLNRIIDSGQNTAIIGDDGEKFGLWPGTYHWVYQEKWLEKFLVFLEEKNIQMMSFSDYLKTRPALGRIYLPPASYEEMMEWVLRPEEQKSFIELKASLPPSARRFLRGGQFREFGLKYYESHHLRCRQLQVSRQVNRHGEESARRELYQAQCNDAYWHGVFGGLYLPHLRRAVYQKLVSAWSRLKLSPGWEKEDFDLDGRPEFFLQHEPFALWFKPDRGAVITELDYLPGKTNLTDCLTRRVEFYHLYTTSHGESGEGKSIHELPRALSEEVKKWLKFDSYQRFSFLERVYPEGLTRDFYESDYAGTPGPFIEKAFEVALDGPVLAAERSAEIITGQGVARIRLRKKIMPVDRGLEFAYEIENQEENPLSLTFVSEWNLALFENEYRLEKNKVIFHDNKLELQAEEAAEVWDFPVKTVSQSEKDFEIITQGISFHLVWPLKLQPYSKRTLTVKLRERSDS